MKTTTTHRDYLGDSVYAAYDGYGIVPTTENGFGASNTIVLEPEVYAALVRYYERLKSTLGKAGDK